MGSSLPPPVTYSASMSGAALRFEQIFHHVQRLVHQRPAALVIIGDRNRNGSPAFAHRVQIDHDSPGVRIERFLANPAFFQQSKMLGLREPVALVAGGGQLRQDLVEIVAAQSGDAFGSERTVRFLAHFHQRRVECSAAQIVHQNHAVDFGFVAEFDARGGRLVQQSDHVASGGAKRLHREKALVGIGIGRNAEHHFQLFLRQQRAQRRGHFAQHLDQRHLLIG